MNVLFICSQGQNRSRTAAELFKDRFKTKFAGLYCDRPVTEGQLVWADIVVVIKSKHRSEIAKRFPRVYLQKRILMLGIQDDYRYNQPELIKPLQSKMSDITKK